MSKTALSVVLVCLAANAFAGSCSAGTGMFLISIFCFAADTSFLLFFSIFSQKFLSALSGNFRSSGTGQTAISTCAVVSTDNGNCKVGGASKYVSYPINPTASSSNSGVFGSLNFVSNGCPMGARANYYGSTTSGQGATCCMLTVLPASGYTTTPVAAPLRNNVGYSLWYVDFYCALFSLSAFMFTSFRISATVLIFLSSFFSIFHSVSLNH